MGLFKALNPAQAGAHFDRYFRKIQAKRPSRPTQIRVVSEKLGLDYAFPPDSTHLPYHTASIGKMFTAVLVYRLADQGLLAVQDRITDRLPPEMLAQLFVYQGVDYADQVTLEHLLGHTSGIADYFEGETTSGKSFIDEVLANPDCRWTPHMLLDFSRNHQSAVGLPGAVFNYSDTGYILLGLVIEAVTRKSFAQNLQDEIFDPLEMRDSYLMFHSEPLAAPKKPLERIWFNDVEISRFESLSCDWAGGGVVSTTADLLKFNRALRRGRLVPARALAAMDACEHKFRPGIYYGQGMMEIRFKEFFFLLGRLPKVRGHIGVLATHLFYDPVQEAHIILNFGDNTRMVESFRALIEIENVLQRLRQI